MRIIGKILLLLIAVMFMFQPVKAQELDSLQQRVLSDKLDEYFSAIEREGPVVQKQECDFLISSSEDSLVRQFIALKAYDHYMNSPVMGAEAVAIHVLDEWFIPGKVKMKSDIDMINARVYADFNRQSLIGMSAPELTMVSVDGRTITLFGDENHCADSNSRFSILYFYDTDCAKCKIESILMRNILEDNDFPVDVYAVYSGDDREEWEDYISKQLSIDSQSVQVTHLWDPELDSDFQRKYGVLQTPRIFLVRPDGVIIGRGLDVEALYTMLRGIFTDTELSYGSDESAELFDGIFASEDGIVAPSKERVTSLVDYISDSTLPKGDTLMFRQLSGDLLYYLATRSGEGIKEGLKYLIEENIHGCPQAWDSEDDSLKVVGFAQIMDDLLSKAIPGTLIPDLKIPAEKVTARGSRAGTYRLRKLKGKDNIIIFYIEGCDVCAAEKKEAVKLAETVRNTSVYFINVDEILEDNPTLSEQLFDLFDLSILPYIIQIDAKGKVIRRYMTFLS